MADDTRSDGSEAGVSPRDARSGKLEHAASIAAGSWARRRMDEVRAEGRAVAGGWPGTMREARGCVRMELAREGLLPASYEEIERVARRAYTRARDVWLASATRDEEEEPPRPSEVPHP